MIRHHVRSFGGNKIMAVKLVRELTNCGLEEAKDLVESSGGFFVAADAQTQARVAKDARQYKVEFDPPLDGTTFTMDTSSASGGGGYSVRYISGTQLINAIKLVRELTGLGLKDAKDVVDQRGLVRTDLSFAQAQELVGRFAEIDSRVEVLGHNDAPSLPPPRITYDFEKEEDYDF